MCIRDRNNTGGSFCLPCRPTADGVGTFAPKGISNPDGTCPQEVYNETRITTYAASSVVPVNKTAELFPQVLSSLSSLETLGNDWNSTTVQIDHIIDELLI